MTAAHNIFDCLNSEGYCNIAEAVPENEQRNIIDSLGHIWASEDVKLLPDSRRKLHSTSSMPLHNDDPRVDYIVWVGVEDGRKDEYTTIVDGLEAMHRMPADDQRNLSRVMMKFPLEVGGRTLNHRPMFETFAHGLYYCPWYIDNEVHQDVLESLTCFQKELAALPIKKISLRKGNMLVVDNKRMLHGRTNISSDSPRWLKRHWIRK